MRALLAVLIVLAACGDDENLNKLPDAPVVTPDAPPDAAAFGPVALTVTVDGVGVPDVVVHFQNADSSVVATASTNAQGVATANMLPGGFVTAIDPFVQPIPQGIRQNSLFTFAGVKPGDQLRLANVFNPPLTSFNLTFAAEPAAGRYELSGPCLFFPLDVTDTDGSGGGSGPGGPLTLDCTGMTDFLVTAFDAANGAPIKTLFAPNVSLTEGGTLDLGSTYANLANATFSYTGVPATFGSLNVVSFLAGTRGTLTTTTGSALVTDNAATTGDVPRAQIAGAFQITDTTFFGSDFGRQHLLEWGPATANYSATLDANTLVPDYAGAPSFEFPNNVRFTIGATGATPDFTIASIDAFREVPLQAWNWQLVAPFTAGAVQFPVLPDSGAIFNPIDGTDSVDLDDLVTVKMPGGYDAIRENVFTLDDPTGLVSGPTGRVVFQELQLGKKRSPQRAAKVLRPWLRDKSQPAKRKRR